MSTTTTTPIISQDVIDKITDAWDLNPETIAALLELRDGSKIPDLIDADGDDIERYGFNWSDIADDSWDDDCGERIYQLAPGVFAHIGTYERAVFTAKDIRDFLNAWDWDSYGSPEALFVAFGLDPDLNEASEDHVGEVRIWCSYNYFQGTSGAPQDAWVCEDDYSRDPLVFESYAEAAEWIEQTEDSARAYKSETDPRGCYVLAHGEASPPDYTICIA